MKQRAITSDHPRELLPQSSRLGVRVEVVELDVGARDALQYNLDQYHDLCSREISPISSKSERDRPTLSALVTSLATGYLRFCRCAQISIEHEEQQIGPTLLTLARAPFSP